MSRVVYIDDEQALCTVLRLVLQRTGAEVRTFTDPDEALRFLADEGADVVLCDYRMPGLSGLELLERIERPVPFVMVSGDLGVATELRDDPRIVTVVNKPFRSEELVETVRSLLPS